MISVDINTNTASVNGVTVELTPQMAVIAYCLAKRKVARHDWVMSCLWSVNEPGDPMQVLQTQVCKLRRRLAPHGVRIRVRRGLGYVLEAA